MFRYKKNIQENDLPRKRVRKASKIAGSGGQYLEIRYPERGRKMFLSITTIQNIFTEFGNKIPREGTEKLRLLRQCLFLSNLEIRYPERGRKLNVLFAMGILSKHLEIRYPERGRKLFMFRPPFKFTTLIWK